MGDIITIQEIYYARKHNRGMIVDREGDRFVFERAHYTTRNGWVAGKLIEGNQPYIIFDDAMADPTDEQLASRTVTKADTIAELADILRMPNLATTVTTYNSYGTNWLADPLNLEEWDVSISVPGFAYADPGFIGTPRLTITTGPFYAIELRPNIMGTMGGVKTNWETGQVLNSAGQPIPGLYAAGETANRPFYDKVYNAGTGMGIAGTTGRAAGIDAADFVAALNL